MSHDILWFGGSGAGQGTQGKIPKVLFDILGQPVNIQAL